MGYDKLFDEHYIYWKDSSLCILSYIVSGVHMKNIVFSSTYLGIKYDESLQKNNHISMEYETNIWFEKIWSSCTCLWNITKENFNLYNTNLLLSNYSIMLNPFHSATTFWALKSDGVDIEDRIKIFFASCHHMLSTQDAALWKRDYTRIADMTAATRAGFKIFYYSSGFCSIGRLHLDPHLGTSSPESTP